MVCPKIIGKAEADQGENYELNVPAYLECEKSTFRTEFDMKVVNNVRARLRFKGISKMRSDSTVKDFYQGIEAEFVNCQLSLCPLPINQGPIIPGIDNDKSDTF